MFLILMPENKEIFTKLLKYLDKKGWTFGRGLPIEGYKSTILDYYIFLYKDKTIRIGAASSLDYVSRTIPIITINNSYTTDIFIDFDKYSKKKYDWKILA